MTQAILLAASLALGAEPPAKGEVVLDGLTSPVPASWKAQKPDNLLRPWQFVVPGTMPGKDDAVVFVLNTVAGSAADNIAKLKELFILPAGMPKDEAVREWQFKNAKAAVSCVDVRGTYHVKTKPIDKAVKEVRPDHRMIAAVWIGKDASYAIRLVGPQATVERHAKEFEAWLRNFK